MAVSTFDTLKAMHDLVRAGIDQEHAEAIVSIHSNAGEELVTRNDLKTAVAEIRADLYRALWIQGTGVVVILGTIVAVAAALKLL